MMLLLIKAAIMLSILLGFYKLFLQKESFFTANRWYLIIGLVLSFGLPFVTLPDLINHQGVVDQIVSESRITTIDENPGVEESVPNSEVPNHDIRKGTSTIVPSDAIGDKGLVYWIGLLYFFGVSILSLNFLTQLLRIFLKINKSRDRFTDDGCIILNQTEEIEPCSFFNYVFINAEKYEMSIYEQILEHEKIHAKKYHSLDLLLSEITIIILWFNPLVWSYRKEVEKNIEYQTDALLLESNRVVSEDYQMNLLGISSYKKSSALVSNYNQSLIKKRIIMMNKQKSNSNSYWKYAFLAPTLFVTLLVLNQPSTLQAQETLVEAQNDMDGENDYKNEFDDDLKPLLRAVRHGNLTAVKKMLENGVDVNLMQNGEGTPLTMAIRSEEFKMAQLLLERGADPNLGTNSDGYPLWMAARKGDIELVRLLISKGADVNTKFPGDGSALIQAAKKGNLEMVKVLVDLKADVNMSVKGDGNPLIMASKAGSMEAVKYLVSKGADINKEVPGDETPLINASEHGYLSIVKFLVEKGADVNKECKEKIQDGSIRVRTALKMAKKKGHDEVVTYLKDKGAVK